MNVFRGHVLDSWLAWSCDRVTFQKVLVISVRRYQFGGCLQK